MGRINNTAKWFFIVLFRCNTGKPVVLMKIVVSVNSVIEVVDFDNALYGVPK